MRAGGTGRWQQCQDMFTLHGCHPRAAGTFFERMADPLRNGDLPLTLSERVILLTTALKWFTAAATTADVRRGPARLTSQSR